MSPSTRLDSTESRTINRSQHTADAGAEPFVTRHRDREQKRFAVLTAAADLFLNQGYRQTRLDDIAERLTITKPALYNYFRSKQDILLGCHILGHDIFDRGFEDIEREGGDGANRLSKLIRVYAGVMTEKFGMCLVRLDRKELSAVAQRQIRVRRRAVNARLKSYLEMGNTDGTLMKCDPKFTSFAMAGALNGIAYWYRPDGELSSGQISELFVQSLVRRAAV